MQTGWLRKSQWLKHKEDNPNCFMDWEAFKRVWSEWCNKDMSRVLPEAKKIADKIKERRKK